MYPDLGLLVVVHWCAAIWGINGRRHRVSIVGRSGSGITVGYQATA